jgi:DNA-binding NarL/FixJ family response regulator
MSKRIRILVAEDQPLARCSTAFLLNTHEGLEVVAEAADGQETVELVRQHQPDVVVLDYQMPRMSGVHVIALIRANAPDAHVIVYSANDSQGVIDASLEAGATAFVSKNDKIDPLIEAIRNSARD